jgi:hypothetical protein
MSFSAGSKQIGDLSANRNVTALNTRGGHGGINRMVYLDRLTMVQACGVEVLIVLE